MADITKTAPDWVTELGGINKELEERVLAANEDKTLVKWNKLLPDLMGAEVLIIGQFTTETNEKGEKQFGLLMLQKDGRTFVPFFTNPDKLSAISAYEQGKFDVIKINVVKLFNMVKGNIAVLNPTTPYEKFFNPFEIKVLANEYADKAPPEGAEESN